ncbi:fibronectin type 3 domain-containing protein [Natronocella acetinitrilica]|uniref:Fibronectin type 3 domain-containing protein n=1 Tax=Natronocella acetinitrilica TaxID=414046 RepID=A0AAE3KBE2_9GAMM|nr:hypothetical protein [Natronocella acetinitrilica]MCP1674571.1 fibronectin type 3 domain-containing protein [Natronocella acetinitrilica]
MGGLKTSGRRCGEGWGGIRTIGLAALAALALLPAAQAAAFTISATTNQTNGLSVTMYGCPSSVQNGSLRALITSSDGPGTATANQSQRFQCVSGGSGNPLVLGPYTTLPAGETISIQAQYRELTGFNMFGAPQYSNWMNLGSTAQGFIPIRPETPVNVTATTNRTGDIQISWSAVSDADRIAVQRALAGNNFNNVATFNLSGGATAYTDTTANAGSEYEYRVQARRVNATPSGNLTLWSSFSAPETGYRLVTPAAPATISASTDRTDAIEISWSAVSSATHYQLQRRSPGGSWSNRGTELTATTLTEAVPAGEVFEYQVRARNANDGYGWRNSAYQGLASGYRLLTPGAPSSVTATTDRQDAILITWGAGSNADRYQIERNTGSGWESIAQNVLETGFMDTGIDTGASASYRVRAQTLNGPYDTQNSAWVQAQGEGYRLLPEPAAVTALLASDGEVRQTSISWSAVSAATRYRVRVTGPGDFSQTQTTTETALTVGAMADGTTYTVEVRAENDDHVSTWSTTTATTRALPGAPADLNATRNTDADAVRLTWSAAGEAESYAVLRSGSESLAEASVVASVGSAQTHYDDTSAAPGASYWYWVRADNAAGTGGVSAGAEGIRLAIAPPPADLAAGDGESPDHVTLSWSAVALAAGYEIRRDGSVIATVPQAGYQDTGATPGVAHNYTVASVNAAGTSEPSAAVTGLRLIAPDQPQSLSASTGRADGIHVTWESVALASRYDLYRNGAFLTALIDTAYLDTDPAPGEIATYTVRAVNAAGASQASGSATGQRAASGYLFRSGVSGLGR